MSVAESIVIFGPMFQVGCARASAGGTSARSSRGRPPAPQARARPAGGGPPPRETWRTPRSAAIRRASSPRLPAATAQSPSPGCASMISTAWRPIGPGQPGGAARTGRSRSALIREAITQYLRDDLEAAIDAAIVEGYTRIPQEPDPCVVTMDDVMPLPKGLLAERICRLRGDR